MNDNRTNLQTTKLEFGQAMSFVHQNGAMELRVPESQREIGFTASQMMLIAFHMRLDDPEFVEEMFDFIDSVSCDCEACQPTRH